MLQVRMLHGHVLLRRHIVLRRNMLRLVMLRLVMLGLTMLWLIMLHRIVIALLNHVSGGRGMRWGRKPGVSCRAGCAG